MDPEETTESIGRLKIYPSGRAEIQPEADLDSVPVHFPDRGAALDGDRVVYAERRGRQGPQAQVVRVVERSRQQLAGLVAREDGALVLRPDDPRLPTPVTLEDRRGAVEGEAVVARITGYPDGPEDGLVAAVTHRLGNPEDPRNAVKKLLVLADVEEEHEQEVLDTAHLPAELTEADLQGREDLRHLEFFTIDPGDARDFDDAVCVEERPDGFTLHVAVADVSHYVHAETVVDRAAAQRALTVYLPDRAIHMLPAALSTGVCSLAPRLDRLAMVVRLEVEPDGVVSESDVVPGVIRSRERLDYEGVAAVLAGREGRGGTSDSWRPELDRLARVASTLHRAREARGGLDFDLPEPKVVLDEDDPLAVRDVRRAKPDRWIRRAYQLIEECMVAANQAVGRFCAAHGLHVIWRAHERPIASRFHEFKALARALGLQVKGKKPDSRTLQAALRRIAGHRAQGPLSLALLRCLAQAVYSAENLGHFALAAPSYLHFTSPIRRYPDLVTHRAVKHFLSRTRGFPRGDPAPPPSARDVARLAERCSGMEQRISQVERQVVDVYRAFVMREHLDQVLRGRIVGVMGFGLFVQLDEPFADGLLPVQELGPDRFDPTPEGASLKGRRSDVRFTLGQPIDVRVVEVSVTQRQVRFALAQEPQSARSGRRRPGQRGRRGRPPPRRSRHTGRGRGRGRRR